MCNFRRKNGRFAFSSPLWGLGLTMFHFRLIGKRAVDFLVLIELFSLGVTAEGEYRLKIGVFARMGSVWPKISGTSGRPSPTILRDGKL